MLYDKATMTELANTLKTHYGQLVSAGSDMNDASTKLQTAWTNENTGESNGSWNSFQGVKTRWDNEYGDTLETLSKVATEVDNALNRALSADQKIGDGFSF
ncbi:WXG100 family type VII secretion target [Nocardia jejuensis]|uniref:WXG100 family type VII secretion target n=1 Tax=Nocardia jejuensis TaxID=328049 RepID=UPI000AE9A8D0|nr:hypothetical protein [Nocardia jejuensis]